MRFKDWRLRRVASPCDSMPMKGGVWFVLMFAMLIGACGEEAPGPSGSGSLAGLVVVSGPLRNAQIAIDQLDSNAPGLTIRTHVGDTMTSADGRFEIDVGKFNGTLLVTARGGEFTDLVSHKKVQLDPTSALETVVPLDLFEARDDVLVSPVGHLIAARTRGTNEKDSRPPTPRPRNT
jgi:hypothetical protein